VDVISVVSRILTRVLFGVTPLDAIAFSMPAFLAAVALTPSYVAARRALRLDPIIALRHE
jgi:putative ABC transport system permease protein